MDDGLEITRMLEAAGRGDAAAAARLYDSVYQELHRIARAQRRRWRGDDTLNTTALIHEAYVKLASAADASYQNRTHFYATASKAMRQILASYAERRQAAKRSGQRVELDPEAIPLADDAALDELLAIDALLRRIEADDPRRCRIVECRVFGGMSVEETAAALGVSAATVKRDWSVASAWLYRELSQPPE